ncbi:MAG: PEGA domain-containing protein, partial [Phycisphaerae bacterium]|nr:PEGA domain-containing protein [Phycisphaerae bacterium]MDW8263459.1 PEGA domain-containing protein [Phycisphaerales bacterium]
MWKEFRVFARTAVALVALVCASGCTVTREFTISAKPADAVLKVEGVERGRGPITEVITFNNENDVRRVTASRLGYKDQTITLTRDMEKTNIVIELKPQSKRVTVNVSPVPATILVDGRPITAERVTSTTFDLEFTVDARNNWIVHTVSAERPGFLPAQATITWAAPQTVYDLRLEPMRKNLSISTNPPGAQVFIDGEEVGRSPVELRDRPFAFDIEKNLFVPQRVKLVKPGFDPVETEISWDGGRGEYS